MKAEKFPFLPGKIPTRDYPLSRFLPPIPDGMSADLTGRFIPPGGLILDPFGSSPMAALELARAGYRVLVACNNPITAHMLRVLARAYDRERSSRILAALAASRKADERLERHLEDVYQAQCPRCGTINPASVFTWVKGSTSPISAFVICPSCHHRGETPVTEDQLKKLSSVTRSGMHRARALERIASVNDPVRPRVEQALEYYLPRALYVIFTILNRVEGLELNPEDRSFLEALIISGMDAGNTLWAHPQSNPRPRQLTQSAQTHENNIWMAISDSLDTWCVEADPVPLVDYPQAPVRGGITLFQGKYRDLAKNFGSKVPLDGVMAVLPRPNQAFWTLSAIWAGWLWGQEAVQPFRSALIRQRYDWQWYADALYSITSALIQTIPESTPILGMMSEFEPSYLISTLAAFDSTGYGLTGYALNLETDFAQLTWRNDPAVANTTMSMQLSVRRGFNDELNARNQPAEYNLMAAAAGIRLADKKQYRVQIGESSDRFMATSNTIKSELIAGDYVRYRGQRAIEADIWWRKGTRITEPSLDDRVEASTLEFLMTTVGIPYDDLRDKLNTQFPGLSTPPDELIRAVLDSYGEIHESMSGLWRLSPRESLTNRQADLTEIVTILTQTGKNFGYQIGDDQGLSWVDSKNELVYRFLPSTSACVSMLMLSEDLPAEKCILVIPASRANLLLYKIEKNPLLYECLTAGWRIVKFRHIREISAEHGHDPEQWSLQLETDPVEFKPIQMKMF